MASSLSNLVNNLSEGIHRVKCKYGHDDKKCVTCRIEYKYWDCFLEYANFKDYLIEYECLCCNKSYQQKFHENSKRKIFRHIQIYYDDNKSILLLRKGVYPYEYMSDWEKFNETSLPEKKDFYRHLNMENITDADYAYAKRLCKGFEKKNLGDYHDLHVQSNTLFLADVSESFGNMCFERYEFDPANFFSALGLAWQAALKILK